jgi:hypothetical protein
MNTITQGRQQLLVAMVAGSLCVLFGHLGNFASSQAPARYIADISAHHTRFVASELVVAIGAFLLIPAMAGLMRLAPARGGRFTTVGGIFAGIALAGLGAGNLMFGAALESQNSTPASASAAATAPSIPPLAPVTTATRPAAPGMGPVAGMLGCATRGMCLLGQQ